jgi:DNA primase
MLTVVKWAAEQYHRCLLDSPLAQAARQYLGERKLTGDTVRQFGVGYAPLTGDWLIGRATQAGLSIDTLEKAGLFGVRPENRGYYDRFRDRIMFPIRDARGQTVGFGGRILPTSPLSARAPKYYNSTETLLFHKGEHLYGLDEAKQAAAKVGYLAVVEGYTDVLMAHQLGVPQVVSTMGTALTGRHVQNLLRWVPQGRVVLVFDADAGGSTGVDRALEIFVSQEVDLAIATLPEGMDPCDLLVAQGPEPLKEALANAVDALEFKLNHVLAGDGATTLEGQARAVDTVLGIVALAPEMPGQKGAVKQQLIVSRIARRLGLREETVWARLRELRARKRGPSRPGGDGEETEKRQAPTLARERQLLQVLLAEPGLVATAAAHIRAEEIAHPGLRQLLHGLYDLQARGEPPDLDRLRPLIGNPALAQAALDLQEVGRMNTDRAAWLHGLLAEYRKHRLESTKQELQNQLQAVGDHTEAVELLRQLQIRTVGSEPVTPPEARSGS